jgi:alkanesulfonate monooxygenase SsuD/methylene tetrahydromethanopterin reductase-like flavin-dependent oxidoreductase (luciferase family)/FAD/FMN-containing dehydrogenase
MTDYGHDLAFGTFLTPQNQRPQDVVALAQLTERVGLDLATFQDHPYQPAFLDTWTLLSWVAAQTQTLRVSANVLNLPLRPPAVLARAAASLDLLSGGRFELGLGAGSFWDAIEAMGGPRRTPAETVQALSEAIDIIRTIWDASVRGGVRVAGDQYRVWGTKRGPQPAHDISIWIGALKPRMLRLIAEKADGWLPSLFYLNQGDLDRGNRIIDEAASAAGRNPRQIRRLLNVSGAFTAANRGFLEGPPQQWVDELLPLALEQGVSTFILASDDPRSIELWGAEVAPALREAVARERRAAGTPTAEVVRDPKAVTLRQKGVDYDAVPSVLRTKLIEPGDPGYGSVRSNFWYAGSPALVLRPDNVDGVIAALEYARTQRVELSIRSGSHRVTGNSTNDGGVVVDLAGLDQIEVLDPESGRVRLGPGARWGRVAQALLPHELAISSGDYGGVGVGGLATAGGVGFLVRKHGLTIDHLVAAELVLADGRFVRIDAENHPELFWAVRGAGGNFGIVTAFEFQAKPVGDVIYSRIVFDGDDLAELLPRWGHVVESAPPELTSFLYSASEGGRPARVLLLSVYAGADERAAVEALTPLLHIGRVLDQEAVRTPYARVLPSSGSVHSGSPTRPLVSSGIADHITPEVSRLIVDGMRMRAVRWLAIRAVGGAVNDVHPMATAYPHRHQNFSIADIGTRPDRFRRHWDELRQHLDGLYINFETDQRPERLADAFPGETLTKLQRIKAQYDPDNVFNQNFPIPPAPQADESAA